MRALVIDDSKAMRAVLRHILEDIGFAVEEAADGQEGLDQIAASGPFDIALVDWNMPVMDGLTFIKTVTKKKGSPMKLMMVTTEREMEKVNEALNAGAQNYIMKPFSPRAVRDAVELLGFDIDD